MSVNTKMTAIADEIRTLSGTTSPMGLDAMATNVSNANEEIADQEALMEQLRSALEGKSVEGEGVTLPTLTNEGVAGDVLTGKQFINSNGSAVTGTMPNNGSVSTTFDGIDTTSVTIPEGYTSGGTVGLTSAIGDEVSEQAGLIEQISAALEGKGGGGGGTSNSITTCTVVLQTDDVTIPSDAYTEWSYAFTVYNNGAIDCVSAIEANSIKGVRTTTVENVVCGTSFYIYSGTHTYAEAWNFDSSKIILFDGSPGVYSKVLQGTILASNGETVTLTFYDDD